MEKVAVIGRSAGGGILIEITPEEGQPIREYYRGVRCGLSWPTPVSPGYYCLVGQISTSNSMGKYPLRVLREGEDQILGPLFQKMGDDLGIFSGREVYSDLSERFRSYVTAIAHYLKSERGAQGIRLKFAPFYQSFTHGVSLIKEWIKDEGLTIPKGTTVYTQLREIKTEDLKGNPEDVFYAINGLRYVIGAFETSLSSPTIRRPVPTEVLPGAWT